MTFILNIETSTDVCSVSVSRGEEIIFCKEETQGPSHANLLGPFVQEAVEELRKYTEKPNAVAVSAGPGSYTGLRIGVAEAKGLCYAWDIPLLAIDTLEILTNVVLQQNINGLAEKNDVLLCPMLDARRMEVYTCLFDNNLKKLTDTSAMVIDESSFAEILADNKIVFFGNGATKCKEVIVSENAVFLDGIYPSAKYMISLVRKYFNENKFVDIAYYEPFYLKDFIGTIPKKKVL